MNSKAIKSYNLPADRVINVTIDAKPYALIAVSTLAGFALAIFNSGDLLGLAIIALGFFAIMFLPRRILMEFSDDYLVIYNKANHYDCFMIYYEEIVTWSYIKKMTYDELNFELLGGINETVECFGPYRIEKLLNTYAPNKKKKKK